MMQLDMSTWVRFAVWMAIGTAAAPNPPPSVRLTLLNPPLIPPAGFAIYFFYGIKHSSEGSNKSSRQYEPALQTKGPIYTGAPVDSDEEATGP